MDPTRRQAATKSKCLPPVGYPSIHTGYGSTSAKLTAAPPPRPSSPYPDRRWRRLFSEQCERKRVPTPDLRNGRTPAVPGDSSRTPHAPWQSSSPNWPSSNTGRLTRHVGGVGWSGQQSTLVHRECQRSSARRAGYSVAVHSIGYVCTPMRARPGRVRAFVVGWVRVARVAARRVARSAAGMAGANR